MSNTKSYYYFRLKDNFFDDPAIKSIETMKKGYEYICIMQKMYLRALSRGGKLMLTDMIPYDVKSLSHTIIHKESSVKNALEIFEKFELIKILNDKSIYMMQMQELIGKSSSEADRIREYRASIKTGRHPDDGQSCDNVTTKFVQMYNKSTPELELKKEKDCVPDKSPSRGSFYSHVGNKTSQHILDMVKRKK